MTEQELELKAKAAWEAFADYGDEFDFGKRHGFISGYKAAHQEDHGDLFASAAFEQGILNPVQAAVLWTLFRQKLKESQ